MSAATKRRSAVSAAVAVAAIVMLLVCAPIVGAQSPLPTSGDSPPGSSNSPTVSPTATGGAGSQSDASVAQLHQETLEAHVVSASQPQPCTSNAGGENKVDPLTGKPTLCQDLQLEVTKGSIKGETISFEEGTIPVASKANVVYKAGDNVLVDWEYSKDQPSTYHVIDFMRTGGLWVLAAVFVAREVLPT